jgi:aldehyde dehydrogenase (NAD+)
VNHGIPRAPPAPKLTDGKLGHAAEGSSFPILKPATGQEIGRAPDGAGAGCGRAGRADQRKGVA